jgi:hypothetical protein
MPSLTYKSNLGVQVSTATVVIPQTVVSPGTTYFTVAGGYVLITGLIGAFTVSVGGAVSPNIFFTPTAGGSANINAGAAITAFVAGDCLTIDGLLTDAWVPASAGHGSTCVMFSKAGLGIICGPGTLGWITGASVTGNWNWTLWYIPLTSGATVLNNV